MDIRRIYIDEAEQVIHLFDQYRVFYKQPSDIVLASAFIKEHLVNNESVIFVAFDDAGVPVGFTQLYPKYSSVKAVRNWTLNDLYIAENHRKKGIGKNLIDTVISFAKENKANLVQLGTAEDNYNAQHLYESIGFTKHGIDNNFILYRISVV
jgi:ribosomal protein S18 acetylase RimI-like enzyme